MLRHSPFCERASSVLRKAAFSVVWKAEDVADAFHKTENAAALSLWKKKSIAAASSVLRKAAFSVV